MLSVLLILPDFLVILVGFLLMKFFQDGAFNQTFWKGAEKIVFYVLFPPLLFTSVATSNLTLDEAGLYLIVAGLVGYRDFHLSEHTEKDDARRVLRVLLHRDVGLVAAHRDALATLGEGEVLLRIYQRYGGCLRPRPRDDSPLS